MRTLDSSRLFVVGAPLQHDREVRRWYSDGAGACIVLTARGRLVEPHPTFGPTSYRALACRVTVREADDYARGYGFLHLRVFH